MKTATVLFTYNRPWHTQQVINGLAKNIIIPEKLFVFQDGLKAQEHVDNWDRVNKIIHNIDFCPYEIIESSVNKGLAQSIVDGINYIYEEYDSVIVLEDDCVPHPCFIGYMKGGLEKYSTDKRVYAINGYSWLDIPNENGINTHFCGRAGSWGWAQWKDRWDEYSQSYKLLGEIKNDEKKIQQFNIWGQDLESYILGNIYGRCDSWTVFWALQCIKRGGYCLTPNKSLIDNIGFDGSGVHCENTERTQFLKSMDDYSDIIFPPEVEYIKNYEKLYEGVFHFVTTESKLQFYNTIMAKWIEYRIDKIINDYLILRNIKNIYCWGKNNISSFFIREIKKPINVLGYIETTPSCDEYEGIPVYAYTHIPDDADYIVVIPAYDIEIIRHLLSKEIAGKIIGIDELIDEILKVIRNE